MATALTIAGSDSSGGAGIQADLKTFAAFGVYGTSAVTAVTAQNTQGVTAIAALSADLVAAQIETIAGDIELHATKVGMLATAAIVEAVVAAIDELELALVVVDPVLASSGGERLLDQDGVQALLAELLRRAYVVTPNIPEAEVLSGVRIFSPDDARKAAKRIREMGAGTVIITGGHRAGADVVDLFYDGHSFSELRTTRVEAGRTHGTGCTFASAVAASLALGCPLLEAARDAQLYVAGAIRHGLAIGHGSRVLNHFWRNAAASENGTQPLVTNAPCRSP
jgi:hydroxymethylpyrimidine/phosphomethylpyrimidine kinase